MTTKSFFHVFVWGIITGLFVSTIVLDEVYRTLIEDYKQAVGECIDVLKDR